MALMLWNAWHLSRGIIGTYVVEWWHLYCGILSPVIFKSKGRQMIQVHPLLALLLIVPFLLNAQTRRISGTVTDDRGTPPAGWDNWRNVENEKTAYYAEYNSTLPGANPSGRVSWPHQLTKNEAKKYMLKNIFGDWMPKAN